LVHFFGFVYRETNKMANMLILKAYLTSVRGKDVSKMEKIAILSDVDERKILSSKDEEIIRLLHEYGYRFGQNHFGDYLLEKEYRGVLELLQKLGYDVASCSALTCFNLSFLQSLKEDMPWNWDNTFIKACANGQVDVAEFCLSKGVDVNVKDKRFGSTGLMYAAQKNHFSMVKMLLNKGADVSIMNPRTFKRCWHYNCESNGFGLRNVLKSRFHECKHLNDDEIELIEKLWIGVKNVETLKKFLDMEIPLPPFTEAPFFACRDNNFELFKAFVEAGIDVATKYKQNTQTCIQVAAKYGCLEIVKYLCGFSKTKDFHNSAFVLACLCKHVDVAEYFLKEQHVDVNFRDNDGYTALMYGCQQFQPCGASLNAVVTLLLNYNADISLKDRNGKCPGDYLCSHARIRLYNWKKEVDANNQMKSPNNEKPPNGQEELPNSQDPHDDQVIQEEPQHPQKEEPPKSLEEPSKHQEEPANQEDPPMHQEEPANQEEPVNQEEPAKPPKEPPMHQEEPSKPPSEPPMHQEEPANQDEPAKPTEEPQKPQKETLKSPHKESPESPEHKEEPVNQEESTNLQEETKDDKKAVGNYANGEIIITPNGDELLLIRETKQLIVVSTGEMITLK
jgi:ankyrin repeat protein